MAKIKEVRILVQKIQMKVIEQTYDVQDDDYGYLSNSVQLLNRFTKDIYQELKETADKEPQRFVEENYLEQMTLAFPLKRFKLQKIQLQLKQ